MVVRRVRQPHVPLDNHCIDCVRISFDDSHRSSTPTLFTDSPIKLLHQIFDLNYSSQNKIKKQKSRNLNVFWLFDWFDLWGEKCEWHEKGKKKIYFDINCEKWTKSFCFTENTKSCTRFPRQVFLFLIWIVPKTHTATNTHTHNRARLIICSALVDVVDARTCNAMASRNLFSRIFNHVKILFRVLLWCLCRRFCESNTINVHLRFTSS